jgi:hypothetical protein
MNIDVSKEFIAPVFMVYIIYECGPFLRTYFILRRYVLSRLHAKIQREVTFQPRNPRYLKQHFFTHLFFWWEQYACEDDYEILMRRYWLEKSERKAPFQCNFVYHKPHVGSGKRIRTSEVRGRRLSARDIRIHGAVTVKTNLDTYRTENINS